MLYHYQTDNAHLSFFITEISVCYCNGSQAAGYKRSTSYEEHKLKSDLYFLLLLRKRYTHSVILRKEFFVSRTKLSIGAISSHNLNTSLPQEVILYLLVFESYSISSLTCIFDK